MISLLRWESAREEQLPRGIAIAQGGLKRPRATASTGLSTRISPARRRRSGFSHQLHRRSKAPGSRGAESQCRQTTAVYVNLQRETRQRVTCALFPGPYIDIQSIQYLDLLDLYFDLMHSFMNGF